MMPHQRSLTVGSRRPCHVQYVCFVSMLLSRFITFLPLCQDSLSSQLAEKEQTMEKWRQERDALVAALEVQLKKLLCSQAEKDKLIQQLRQNTCQLPQEVSAA